MKILKWILGSLLALLVIIFAIAFMLSNEYAVSRTATIKAPAEKIFTLVADPKE